MYFSICKIQGAKRSVRKIFYVKFTRGGGGGSRCIHAQLPTLLAADNVGGRALIHAFRNGAACCAILVGGGLVAALVNVSALAQSGPVQSRAPAFCRQAPMPPSLPPEKPMAAGESNFEGKPWGRPSPPPPPSPASPPVMSGSDSAHSRVEMAAPLSPPSVSAKMSDRAVSSRAEARVAAPPTPPSPSFIPPRPPLPHQPDVQSGLLTAGEHDDILNSKLYAAYVRDSQLGQSITDLPLVNTRQMVRVDVKDINGKPVPFTDVVVRCSDGNELSLQTHSNGSALFFTGLDRLSPTIMVQARKQGRVLSAAKNLRISGGDGGQQVTLTASGAGRSLDHEQAKALDLMLVIDTTGSMGDEIRYLQAELMSIVQEIKARHRQLDVRIGFVFYRDDGDAYVTQTMDFTPNISNASSVLGQQSANGGGDYPEAMDQAMIRAVGASWRKDSVKSLLLVADAPPHDDKFGRTWAAAETARAKNIQITPVAASGVGDKAEYVMRAMAAATQSRYIFLTDDSGIGNPHAPPAVACYVVTRLDALLRRVIDSQLSGRRIEPENQEVIRTVGQYDQGKCALPNDFRWQ